MKISLTNSGKRYNREWIFRNINYSFISGQTYAITGPNGSGKSTLLKCIGGALQLSEGDIQLASSERFPLKKNLSSADDWHPYISIAAPYLELIEEYTLLEFLRFHEQFKPFLKEWSAEKIMETMQLSSNRNKQIRYFSSGMKQRVKLAQAIFSDVPGILLDEPCTNLDKEGIRLYQTLIDQFSLGRLIVISSNDPIEYAFCRETLSMADYKK